MYVLEFPLCLDLPLPQYTQSKIPSLPVQYLCSTSDPQPLACAGSKVSTTQYAVMFVARMFLCDALSLTRTVADPALDGRTAVSTAVIPGTTAPHFALCARCTWSTNSPFCTESNRCMSTQMGHKSNGGSARGGLFKVFDLGCSSKSRCSWSHTSTP